MKLNRFGLFMAFALLLLSALAMVAMPRSATSSPDARADLAAMAFEPYDAQRVVYHVTDGKGLFERKWKNLLHVAKNHVDAVAFGELDLRIVMQGGGIDLLRAAAKDAALATEIDRLKRQGVRFVVCKNTLALKGIDPATLHGVSRADIVSSSVAEAAKLARDGYVYMKM
jgi:uncharacterized protein